VARGACAALRVSSGARFPDRTRQGDRACHAEPRAMSMQPENIEHTLAHITLAPYIVKAMALIGVRRWAGSNMFRHQISTMGILLDYKIVDPVLLKAAVIHDLFEDAPNMPGVTEEAITRIDADGPEVYALVMEVTIRTVDGVREPKSEYLLRIMHHGSSRARVLKLADRISNLTALGFVHDRARVQKYIDETKAWILPFAEAINVNMYRELSDLLANRQQMLEALGGDGH
jgi:(p)ppGpp synthase/HD superfamily hydrolase